MSEREIYEILENSAIQQCAGKDLIITSGEDNPFDCKCTQEAVREIRQERICKENEWAGGWK